MDFPTGSIGTMAVATFFLDYFHQYEPIESFALAFIADSCVSVLSFSYGTPANPYSKQGRISLRISSSCPV